MESFTLTIFFIWPRISFFFFLEKMSGIPKLGIKGFLKYSLDFSMRVIIVFFGKKEWEKVFGAKSIYHFNRESLVNSFFASKYWERSKKNVNLD